jgi:hypothetical protein
MELPNSGAPPILEKAYLSVCRLFKPPATAVMDRFDDMPIINLRSGYYLNNSKRFFWITDLTPAVLIPWPPSAAAAAAETLSNSSSLSTYIGVAAPKFLPL